MSAALSELERAATKILADLRRLEQIPLRSVAKMLRKSPDWVRLHLPIVILGPKSHRVRLADIETFLQKRTIWPNGKFPRGAARLGTDRPGEVGRGAAGSGMAWRGKARQ